MSLRFEPLDAPSVAWIPPVKEISIDIGSRNLAIRVEQTDPITGVPLGILYDLVDLAANKENLDEQCVKMSQYFAQRHAVFSGAKVVVVEQQRLIHNQITNATRNIRMMQHVFSYFQIVHPEVERVELSPLMKTGAGSGAPKDMDREDRKEWGVAKATELLTQRGDTMSLQVITAAKKKDDLTDTVIQLWMYRKWRCGREAAGLDTTMVYQPGKRKPRRKTTKKIL